MVARLTAATEEKYVYILICLNQTLTNEGLEGVNEKVVFLI